MMEVGKLIEEMSDDKFRELIECSSSSEALIFKIARTGGVRIQVSEDCPPGMVWGEQVSLLTGRSRR